MAQGLLIAAFLVLFIHLLRNKYGRGLAMLPGPWLAAYTGLWRWKDVRSGKAHQRAIELHRKYGPIVRIGPHHVSISDPQEIKNIYGLKSGYTKTAFYPIQSITWKGKVEVNLFGTYDEEYHRKLKRPVANAYSLSTLLSSEQAVDSCTELLVSQLARFADGNTPVDFGEWIQFYTFDTVGELTFGMKLGFLDAGSDVDGIIHAIENLLTYASQVGQVPIWHKFLMGNPLLPILLPSMEGWDKVLSFTLKAVNTVTGRDTGSEEKGKQGDELDLGSLERRGDMLSKWYALKLSEPDKISTRDLVVHLSTNVFAGSDTTAIALRAVFYYLLKSPIKMQKLVLEIESAFVRGQLGQPISFQESKNNLPYLQAVLKEALRIHPSVGLLLERYVPPGGAKLCGHHVPEGTIVGINAWVTQHDRDVFPNPEKFEPERWLDASEEELKIMDQSFFAFGAGPRTCIGRHIAMMEMAKVVPEILHKFELSLSIPEQEWETRNIWFVQQKGLVCTLKRRV
ncbi:cytochrome P450 [Penicillium canescens]|nr:cytochrome P450 [Penicillium canescens]KAJ6158303.1 cytochrome P450 [Penicillium canescens]